MDRTGEADRQGLNCAALRILNLIVSVLPRWREQNDRIVAMLREQNGLLGEFVKEPHRI